MEYLDYFKDENFENLKDMINEKLKEGKIIKIYKGKDEHCRCGCGGKYHDDHMKFKRYIANALKTLNELKEFGDQRHKNRFAIDFYPESGNINIPIFNERNPQYNQCYTIYFKI